MREITSQLLKNERLKRGMNRTQFAQFLGVNRTQYSGFENGDPIPEINAARIALKLDEQISVVNEEPTKYRSDRGIDEQRREHRKAQAGRKVPTNYRVEMRKMAEALVEDLPDGDYEIFDVEGASMSKTILPGDKLVCKPDSIDKILNGRIYVLVISSKELGEYRPSGIWIKRCYLREKAGYITCRSDNKDSTEPYITFQIKLSEVSEVWYPVRRSTDDLSDPNRDIYEKLDEIESRLELIESELNLENQ